MLRSRNIQELSVEELEQMLRIKRRQSRIERFQRLSQQGQTPHDALIEAEMPERVSPKRGGSRVMGQTLQPMPTLKERFWQKWRHKPKHPRSKFMDRLLLGVEVTALLTLFGVIGSAYLSLQELNTEAALAQQSVVAQQLPVSPTAVPPIALVRLPGGHTPPTSPDGALPDIPIHLQKWVQPHQTNAPIPLSVETSPQSPTRIVIPKIKVDAPIVSGVGWEDLKKGVGHLPGSANPGERGNLYLAAHNDIYGEIFRYLGELEVGDDYFIYAGEQKFHYVVKQKRIIAPTEVEVMLPSTEPISTLQTCHPYLIDTHRLVVIGELAE